MAQKQLRVMLSSSLHGFSGHFFTEPISQWIKTISNQLPPASPNFFVCCWFDMPFLSPKHLNEWYIKSTLKQLVIVSKDLPLISWPISFVFFLLFMMQHKEATMLTQMLWINQSESYGALTTFLGFQTLFKDNRFQ